MTSYEERTEAVKKAISDLNGDTSVSVDDKREALLDIRDHVDTLLDALSEEDS